MRAISIVILFMAACLGAQQAHALGPAGLARDGFKLSVLVDSPEPYAVDHARFVHPEHPLARQLQSETPAGTGMGRPRLWLDLARSVIEPAQKLAQGTVSLLGDAYFVWPRYR